MVNFGISRWLKYSIRAYYNRPLTAGPLVLNSRTNFILNPHMEVENTK